MILLIALAALSAVAVIASVRALFSDGFRALPTDRTRLP
jgi:hypothetical protein